MGRTGGGRGTNQYTVKGRSIAHDGTASGAPSQQAAGFDLMDEGQPRWDAQDEAAFTALRESTDEGALHATWWQNTRMLDMSSLDASSRARLSEQNRIITERLNALKPTDEHDLNDTWGL